MMVACSGIASPIRNSPLTDFRNRPLPRTMAKAAMKEMRTAGMIEPMVTMTLLMKYCAKSDSMTSW